MGSIWKSRNFLAIVIFLQSMMYAAIFLDVPVARQVIGFLYLTFVPGIVFVRLLKLDKLNGTEIILFSAGLSIAYLMLFGFLANELYSLIGISQPLLSTYLLITLNGVILIGAILSCLKYEDIELPTVDAHKFSPIFLLPISLPILSVAGAFLVNTTGNSSILLFMILAIAVIFILSISLKRVSLSKIYPLIIFSIAIALLFHYTLISNYIYGTDIHMEYHVFKLTRENAYWNSTYFTDTVFGNLNTMLSITILPTIYSNTLNLGETWVLKIVFPLIFSFVPLALYGIWQTKIGKKTAFISALLLMSQLTFYNELPGIARQMIGEVFFVLLFIVILDRKLNSFSTKLCFAIFSFALVVSHYSLAVIFLFFISVALIYASLVNKKKFKNLTLTLAVLFFTIMFSWYIYTSASVTFNNILWFGNYVYRGLSDFLNPASRGTYVMRGLGMEAVESYWQILSRMFAYATQFFILVGFFALLVSRRKRNFNREYFVFMSMSTVLLIACILLPRFAETLNMTRFYHIILFFLAPSFVFGCEALVGFLVKQKTQLYGSILIVIVLVPYFLFQIGFVYEITGDQSWSVPLSKYRMNRLHLIGSYGYVDEQSVFGAQWMSKNINIQHIQMYADRFSIFQLISYGMIYTGDINTLSNTTIVAPNGTLYLSQLNVVYEKIVGENYVWNSTDFFPLLNSMNKIYSNGECDIYASVP